MRLNLKIEKKESKMTLVYDIGYCISACLFIIALFITFVIFPIYILIFYIYADTNQG